MQPASRTHGRHATAATRHVPVARVVMRRRALVEAAVAAGLVASLSLVPAVRADASDVPLHMEAVDGQTIAVSDDAVATEIVRGGIEATPLAETYANSQTNEGWAQLVLLFGEWPVTEQNTTVMLRWMRQENGTNNWFNRNNPLNNGYGSGGGGGLGSYDSLIIAAQKAAENLKRGGGYVDIVAALEKGDSADATARAIWASPWATSHYANGSHWSTAPVDIVKAPGSFW